MRSILIHLTDWAIDPDDIVLGPPRTSFASASSRSRPGENERNEKIPRDADARDRFNTFRNRTGEPDSNDRFRDRRTNNYQRRGDADQDSDGWSTVKPRGKSFGQEGAEIFRKGRMGGDDRYSKDSDNARERPSRNFDRHSRDKDAEEDDNPRRNGMNRGKTEPWFNKESAHEPTERPSQRERIDRAKSWRDRNTDDRPEETRPSRGHEKTFERRWDREQRVEREPEWLDEPLEPKAQGHTEEDFKKFMESMKAGRGGPKAEEKPPLTSNASASDTGFFGIKSAPVEAGPDKFFAAFGTTAGLDVGSSSTAEVNKEPAMPKAAKPSRFTSFFSAQGGDSRGQTEPATPAVGLPPINGGNTAQPQQPDVEKEAFAVLLQKLQRQTFQTGATPPNAGGYPEPPMQQQEMRQKSAVTSPEPYQQYGLDREHRVRSTQPSVHEILAPRPMQPPSQPPSARPEQMLQELVGQRHQAPSQGSGRMEQNPTVNSNTEFLMRLMQSARAAPEPPRTEQLLMRMPQPQKQAAIPQLQEREHEYQRERSTSQHQMRNQGLGGYMEEHFHPSEGDNRRQQPQPTQILQRPPPPGLDHQLPPWMQGGGGGQMPPAQRPMIPPPGLVGNPPNRNIPPPGMFPPNFPPGAFPPEGMGGPPPRNMQPPPGFFGGPPPPGFIPPPGMGGFPQGPEGLAFGGPFDGRGMPPPGAGNAFRRQ